MLTYEGTAGHPQSMQIARVITDIGEERNPHGPARFLAVALDDDQWIALQTDGWIATPNGPFEAAVRWQAGDDVEEIAKGIHVDSLGE